VIHVPTRRIGFEFLQDISAGEKARTVRSLCACSRVCASVTVSTARAMGAVSTACAFR
jgi:hypothetical protein